jgi:hypothetical protein
VCGQNGKAKKTNVSFVFVKFSLVYLKKAKFEAKITNVDIYLKHIKGGAQMLRGFWATLLFYNSKLYF